MPPRYEISNEEIQSIMRGGAGIDETKAPSMELTNDEIQRIMSGYYQKAPDQAPPPPKPSTSVMGLGAAFGRGMAEGLTTEPIGMVGGAMEFAGSYLPESMSAIEDVGRNLKLWSEKKSKEWYGKQPDRSWAETAVYEGSKMFGPSAIPSGTIIAGVRALRGIGKIVKAVKYAEKAGDAARAAELTQHATRLANQAVNIGSAATATLFGLSQGQQTVDNANRRADKLEREGKAEEAAKVRKAGQGWAPVANAAIEAGGEFLGTKALGKMLGVGEAIVFKRGEKSLVREFLKTLGVEVGTEVGQQAGEAAVEKYTDIRPEADPLGEALDVIPAVIFMTLLTGGGGATVAALRGDSDEIDMMDQPKVDDDLNKRVKKQIQKAITEDVPKETAIGLGDILAPVQQQPPGVIGLGAAGSENLPPAESAAGPAELSARVFEEQPPQMPAAESALAFEGQPDAIQKAAQERQRTIDQTYLPAEQELDEIRKLREQQAKKEPVKTPTETQLQIEKKKTEKKKAEEEFDLAQRKFVGRKGRERPGEPVELKTKEQLQKESVGLTSGLMKILDRNLKRQEVGLQSKPEKKAAIDAAANEAATSPKNDLPEPTQGQKEAGTYKKGHIKGDLVNVSGTEITIENPKGSERTGTSKSGNKWSTTLQHHYGYFRRTQGRDGDQIDVFIGDNPDSEKAFIVDQVDPETGKFDEHKTMVGFKDVRQARKAYLSNFEKGWKGLGTITEVSTDELKKWVNDGKRKKTAYSPTLKEVQRDQKDTEGIPGGERKGEKPRGAVQIEKEGGGEVEAGGVLQAQGEEEVKPMPEKPAPEPEARPKPEAPEKAKEPWEMVYSEYEPLFISQNPTRTVEIEGKEITRPISPQERTDDLALIRANHKRKIRKALSKGKSVPDEVLAGYPDLKPKAEPAKKPAVVAKKKPKKLPSGPKEYKGNRLRGRILHAGGVNMLNLKGEVKNWPVGAKYLNKKSGLPYDLLENQLKEEGWLHPNETLAELLVDPKNLRRGKVAGEATTEVAEIHKTDIEKRIEKEMAHETEAPPGDPEDYIQVKAKDLPKGKTFTIIENRSKEGWDEYKVIEKDEFGVTLEDGIKIDLEPDALVEVRKSEIEAVNAKPSLMTPDEAAEAYIKKEQSPEDGSWERSAVSNYAKDILKPVAKRIEKRSEWQQESELRVKTRDGRKPSIVKQLKALVDVGFAQRAWDNQGEVYYSKAGSELPEWLSASKSDSDLFALPDRKSVPAAKPPITPKKPVFGQKAPSQAGMFKEPAPSLFDEQPARTPTKAKPERKEKAKTLIEQQPLFGTKQTSMFDMRGKVKKEAVVPKKTELKEGDSVLYNPNDEFADPVEGIVRDIIHNQSGGVGYNIFAPTENDKYRVVRVWESKGTIEKVVPKAKPEQEAKQLDWDIDLPESQLAQMSKIYDGAKKMGKAGDLQFYKINTPPYSKTVFVRNTKNENIVAVTSDGTPAKVPEEHVEKVKSFILDDKKQVISHSDQISKRQDMDKRSAEMAAEARKEDAKEKIFDQYGTTYKRENGKWFRWDGSKNWVRHTFKKGLPSANELEEDYKLGRVKPKESKHLPVTETPEFKAKLKGTKVVDKDGNPLLTFHGTREEFKEFMKDQPHFFAANPEYADAYAKGWNVKDDTGAKVIPAYLVIKNPKYMSVKESSEIEFDDMERLKKEGFDGVIGKIEKDEIMKGRVIARKGERDEYIVFDTSQVVSPFGVDAFKAEVKPTEAKKSEDPRVKRIVKKLRAVAESTKEKAEEKYNQDRNENTSRRARMAANSRADAARDISIAETMLKIADALESGELVSLSKVSSKTHVDALDRAMNNAQYQRYIKQDIPYGEQQKRKGEPTTEEDTKYAQFFKLGDEVQGRLRTIGISNNTELRAALTELVGLRVERKKESPIKAMERGLIGTKIPGFFPTRKPVVDRMINAAEIENGMDVLEPSAGMGNIAEGIRKAGVEPDVIEISFSLRDILKAKNFNLVGSDFMEYSDKQYDRIIMNPPFENGQDIDHIKHAYDLLNPGGRIVSVVSEGPFFRNDKKSAAFRDWINEVGAVEEKLPEGSFKGKEALRETGVNARVIIIDKPGESTTALYSTTASTNIGTDAKTVLDTIIPELRKWADFPAVRVIHSREIPKKLRRQARKAESEQQGKIEGIYDPESDTVYMLYDNLSEERIKAVLDHEAKGHRGIRLLMGDALNPFLDGVVRAKEKELMAYDPLLTFSDDQEAWRTAADEWLARQIEAGTLAPTWFNKLIAAFRKWLRKFIPNLKLSNNDIKAVLSDMVRVVEKGGKGKGINQFSQPPTFSLKQAAKNILDNPAFKRWFGGSKVVDVDGKPLVVYHGTSPADEIKAFYPFSHFGTKEAAEDRLRGWRGDPDEDNFYDLKPLEGEQIYPVYLSIQNPLRIDDSGAEDIVADLMNTAVDKGILTEDERSYAWGKWESYAYTDDGYSYIADLFESKGFDGVVYENQLEDAGSDSWMVFRPTQIKSIFNRGTFDPTNPDIRYSLSKRMPESRRINALNAASNEISDILGRYAKSVEPFDLSGVPVFDVPGLDTSAIEGKRNSASINTERFSDIFKSKAFISEGYDGLDAEGKQIMASAVLRSLHNDEIRNAVIKFIPINMMDNFTSEKFSSDMGFHDPAMLLDTNPVDALDKIALSINMPSDALADITTFFTTIDVSALRAFNSGNESAEGLAAGMANDLKSSVPKDIVTPSGTKDIFYMRRRPLLPLEHDATLSALERFHNNPLLSDVNIFHNYTFDNRGSQEMNGINDKALTEGMPLFSIKKAKDDLRTDSLSTIEMGKAILSKNRVAAKSKVDLSYTHDLLASIPAFFAKSGKRLIHAVESIYDASQDRMDEKNKLEFAMENVETANGITNTVTAMKNLSPAARDEFSKYLVSTDRYESGYRVKDDSDLGWVVRDRKNHANLHVVGKGPGAEFEAIRRMLEYEAKDLEEKGFSPEQVNAVMAVRATTNKGFDMLFAPMRKLISDAEAGLIPMPKVAVFREGKPVQINLKEAMAMMGDMRGYYFPRIRPAGKFYFMAQKEGEFPVLETFNVQATKKVRMAELEKQGYKVTVHESKKIGEDVFALAGELVKTQQIVNAALARVEKTSSDALSKDLIEGLHKEVENIFAASLAEQISNVIRERGARAHMTRRSDKVYIGYNEDPLVVIPKYIKGLSGAEAKKNMVLKMIRALTGTETSWAEFQEQNDDATYEDYQAHVKEMMISQPEQPNAFKWAMAFIQENTRNPDFADNVVGWLRGAAVAKYLAFRVFSAPVVNLTALPTSTIATLKGAGIPYAKAWRELGTAIVRYGKYRAGSLSGDDKWIFDHMAEKGWDDAQYTSESLSVLRSSLGRGWDKIINVGMFTFSESERLNRAATIAAAFRGLSRLPENKNLSKEKLAEMAKQVSDNSHGVYNKGNYPYIALGGNPAAHVARMFYVFQRFSHTYLMNMKRLGFEEKDMVALAHMAIAPALLAGAGASVLTPIIDTLLRAFGFDEPEEEAYKKIGDYFGPTAENFSRFGIAGLAGRTGVSIKGSLSIGVGAIPTSIKDILGAPGSVFSDIFIDGIPMMAKGDWKKGFEKVLPTGMGNIIRAFRESTEGVTSKSNTPLFYGNKPVKLDPTEFVLRMMSFYPARIAKIREEQYKEYRLESKYTTKRTEIYSKFKKYYTMPAADRTPEMKADILAEIAVYNEKARGLRQEGIYVPYITRRSVYTNLRRSFKPSKKEKLRAIRLNKKANAE